MKTHIRTILQRFHLLKTAPQKRKLILDLNYLGPNAPKALLYYKTDPVCFPGLAETYTHTNNAEIIEIAKILGKFGFSVDLVDRSASIEDTAPLLKRKYALYIGNAAGNSGPLHIHFLNSLQSKRKIMWAAGPEPTVSNLLNQKRHEDFMARTGARCEVRRMVKGEGFDSRFAGLDAIFSVGNDVTLSGFAKHQIPIYRMFPSTHPGLSLDAAALLDKRPYSFLFIGGNGLICKGLDLVLEAFDGLSDFTLDICAPDTECDFWAHYQPLLERNPQIQFHGFVAVGGEFFLDLTRKCGFQVFPGSCEGSATSVLTAMRRGVVPVVTKESGVDTGSFGIQLRDWSVAGLKNTIYGLGSMSLDCLRTRIVETYLASSAYTLEHFRESVERGLLAVLQKDFPILFLQF